MGSSDGGDSAVISGLSPNIPDLTQFYTSVLDLEYTLASAQAFMQGFYPPFQLTDNNGTGTGELIDPTSFLANGSYV